MASTCIKYIHALGNGVKLEQRVWFSLKVTFELSKHVPDIIAFRWLILTWINGEGSLAIDIRSSIPPLIF